MTQKFKVGDKVRVVAEHFMYNVGEEVVVREIDGDGDLVTVLDQSRCDKAGGRWSIGDSIVIYPSKVEKVSTKKQRLSDAEKRIAELEAKVAALEKAQKQPIRVGEVADVYDNGTYIGKFPPLPQTPNEQRKAIIAEAKAFEGTLPRTDSGRYLDCGKYDCTVEYIVNPEKRTVVALLKGMASGIVRYKGVAKYAPDDVFNADIGKAIALGRALGLNVERFEQAVKPTEVVVGQTFKVTEPGRLTGEIGTITKLIDTPPFISDKRTGQAFKCTFGLFGYLQQSQIAIIDDTNAEY